MAICGYLAIPGRGEAEALAAQLVALPGCEVTRAVNRDLFVVVTETSTPDEEEALRAKLSGLPALQSLMLTFGDLETLEAR